MYKGVIASLYSRIISYLCLFRSQKLNFQCSAEVTQIGMSSVPLFAMPMIVARKAGSNRFNYHMGSRRRLIDLSRLATPSRTQR